MRPLHSKRKRITLNDAQLFIKKGIGGGMNFSDYLSDEERENIIRDVSDDILSIVKNNFPRTSNLEYAILKMHLIIEYSLTQFIRCSSYVLVDLDSIKFSFSHKLEIAILLGLGNGDPVLIPTLEILNRLRNQIAHTFNFNVNLIDEIIKLNSEYTKDDLNDRKRISHLRAITNFLCGLIVGLLEAKIYMSSKDSSNSKTA